MSKKTILDNKFDLKMRKKFKLDFVFFSNLRITKNKAKENLSKTQIKTNLKRLGLDLVEKLKLSGRWISEDQ